MQFRLARGLALASTAFVVQAGVSYAQSCFTPGSSRQAVYVAGPNNTISCVLDFASGTTRTVVSGNTGTNFSGLYVLYEGEGSGGGLSLVVGNPTQSGAVQVYDCDARGESCTFRADIATLPQVMGLALNTFGDVAAVNGSALLYARRCAAGDPDCPGGWAAPLGPLAVTSVGQTVQPIDVRFVPSAVETSAGASYQPGDVLVLTSNRLLRFPSTALVPTATSVSATVVATMPAGAEAKGFALFPRTGEALVATNEGRLLVFDRFGTAPYDFGSLGGRKGVAVSIGSSALTTTDPANGAEVFVTTNANGTVQRFVAARSGGRLSAAGQPVWFTTGNPPYGIGNASLTDAAWTSLGTTTVVPARGLEMTLRNIRASGFTLSRPYLLSEDAVRQAGAARGLPLVGGQQTGAITGPMVGLPDAFWREVPWYVQPLARPVTGGWGDFFLVYVISTGADVYGSLHRNRIVETQHGFPGTDCTVAPTQARTFYATDPDDPVIVEDGVRTDGGGTFIDYTGGCGSYFSPGGTYSLYLASGGDARPLRDVVRDKLRQLRSAITGTNPLAGGLQPFITRTSTSVTLVRLVDDAIAAYDANDAAGAQADLDQLIATVDGNPRSFVKCVSYGGANLCRNTPGEIDARATSAAFLVCGADPTSAACSKYAR